MNNRILTGLLCLAMLVGCQAEPEQSDVTRVKEYFLQLRFQSAFQPALQSKSDQELFQLSCKANRVDCDRLLQMLKEQDPDFYRTLYDTASRKRQ